MICFADYPHHVVCTGLYEKEIAIYPADTGFPLNPAMVCVYGVRKSVFD